MTAATEDAQVFVRLSVNEIDSLCLKAARGAGASWGGAEETGFALAWLAKRGIQAAGVLLTHLQEVEGAWEPCRPQVQQGHLTVGDRPAYPIPLGATLSDFAGLADQMPLNNPFSLGLVLWPVLLLPFVAAVAAARGQPLELCWPGGSATLWPDGAIQGDIGALIALPLGTLTVRTSHAQAPVAVLAPLPGIPATVVAGLSALALKTTVPASAASRAGAGAGTSDND
jgi:hypothetical protein